MRVTVVGMGNMGRALAGRLLSGGHALEVWNRTPGRAGELVAAGATELAAPDDLAPGTEAVFVCSADDRSVLDIAAPGGAARASWSEPVVAVMSTVSPQTLSALHRLYGDRLVAAPILGAPQAVTSGEAVFVIAGAEFARSALAPVWELFAGPFDAGDDPARAAVVKLLNNQLLMTGLAAVAETVRVARAAGLDEATLTALLRESAMVPAGLRNRIDGLFDPRHAGWFTPGLGAKDLGHFLGLAPGAPLPVTQAAHDAYVRVAADGWDTADITALVELGRTASD
ncbi:3-hydroxyisobutyrate dehydrogenase-like beta-hydroxyacid dehydrogenase [Nocardia transvalensis]|uniref:3-hydroxyisobutyrate dehydrogenase-like beta-hydroxyacid dehydrogenase n=1 Tax=Nocardia transvalensis TaxID=37333 RepID=A0A7W9UME8_9NOCA|nr:NAD(P)-dependent oxidoreductase [Nocardia transvalensis]MBB5918302.1 3-hydroxyisobutyrate dehydrogenase-like beta-hydroxyacid dehydrogenase [Nocardia transvalensis]